VDRRRQTYLCKITQTGESGARITHLLPVLYTPFVHHPAPSACTLTATLLPCTRASATKCIPPTNLSSPLLQPPTHVSSILSPCLPSVSSLAPSLPPSRSSAPSPRASLQCASSNVRLFSLVSGRAARAIEMHSPHPHVCVHTEDGRIREEEAECARLREIIASMCLRSCACVCVRACACTSVV